MTARGPTLAQDASRELSLYIHVPFCTKKCPYCHFFVLKDRPAQRALFLEALQRDIDRWLPLLSSSTLRSVYLGGGTPSLLTPDELAPLLARLSPPPSCEVTLEANPEQAESLPLASLRALGINRLSWGVQSFDEGLLQRLGRRHTAAQALRAIAKSLEAGIDNVSIDLMYELPHQTLASWRRTLATAADLPIAHLSLYNLTLEEGTPFGRAKASLLPHLPSPEESLAMLEEAVAHFEAHGLKRYEISAFARREALSCHNSGYWTGRPFIGVGPSACSYIEGRRSRTVPDLLRYAKALEEGRSPLDFEEELLYPRSWKELFVLELRLLVGVALAPFEARYGAMPQETREAMGQLQEEGWLLVDGERIQLTERGRLFYDSVATALI